MSKCIISIWGAYDYLGSPEWKHRSQLLNSAKSEESQQTLKAIFKVFIIILNC